MNTALYRNELLQLNQLHRDQFQKIYQAGKNGELFCNVCKENVRLYLGINKSPYFFHTRTPEKSCQTSETHANSNVSEQTYIERNGFRIPQGRIIIEAAKVDESFKQTKSIDIRTPFKENTSNKTLLIEENGMSLDTSQAAAVQEIEGALLVLAGAGSGKTRVLTARTANILSAKNIDPKSIMLVTFTSKAASEMKKRLQAFGQIENKTIQQLVTGTFHSIFYRILLFHQPQKWSSERLLKKEWQRSQILKDAGKELDLSEKEFAFDLALQQISYWKNTLLQPDEIKPESEWEEKTAFLFKWYEEFKTQKGLFDFDDMLIGCYQMFTSYPALLEQYQNRFQYFLIDEFQDINKVQYELIKLLSKKSMNVCAVGDDDQSIYSFRGSDPSFLLDFEKDFPLATVITLEQNYRSSHEIITTANQIISINKQRRPKKMKAQFQSDHRPVLFFPYDEEEEATMIITDLQERIASGAKPSEFAILYRTNASSRAIFERLASSNLPFKIDYDTESFYERRTVKSLLSFLQISQNEDNQVAISDILAPLFLKQSALQDIKALSILHDCSYLEAMHHLKTGHAFQEKKLKKVVQLIRTLKYASPLSAIETIEKEFGFQDFLKKRGNEANKLERGSDDVKDLKVAARNFDSIDAFLAHTKHMSAMIKEVKNFGKHFHDVITLSTIHRAKGLEYSSVYVLGAVDGSLPHDFALDSYRNGDSSPLEEERRLLYVAITRAKEQLFLSIPQNRRGKKTNLSRFLTPLKKYLK
ncbi:MAG TPA: ATP-dependent helicase [Bacillales bacterium]|nr:ATP-dependent helicase [Bacillales bacterium]